MRSWTFLLVFAAVAGCSPDDVGTLLPGSDELPGECPEPCAAEVLAVAARPLSVLLIVADDVGWGDLGVQGGRVPTPALDALAAEGIRFTSAYATAPVCGPSRAGLMTGRQQNRFGFDFNPGPPHVGELDGRGLPDEELSFGEVFGAAGHRTAYIGKWHLGVTDGQRPEARGFDDTLAFLSGQRWSMAPGRPGVLEVWPLDLPPPKWPEGHWSDALHLDGRRVAAPPDRHLTDVITDLSVRWLQKVGYDPFLLVVAYNAVHEPFQAPPEHLARIDHLGLTDPLQRVHAATVAALDAGVGRLLDALDDVGRADDTVVVFVSDNGCVELWGACSNGGWNGGKLRLTEGGLRVPMLMRWPGAPPGMVVKAPVSTLDLLPTLARAARADLPPDVELDGVNLVPFLAGHARRPHESLFWRMGEHRAVREGRYKLVLAPGRRWLFDLQTDPGEQRDLSTRRPALARRLLGLLRAREQVYEPPRWSGRSTELDLYDARDVYVEY